MIDLQIFTHLVSPMITIACLIIGYVIKNAIPNKTINNFIPLIVTISGIALNCWALNSITFETVIAGAASGLISTGTYEAFKNIIEVTSHKDEEPIIIPTGKHFK